MEKLSDVKKMHHQVQNNILQILIDYKIVEQIASTIPTKATLFSFTVDYQFFINEVPQEATTFINSVNRLLETDFLYIVSDPLKENFYFIKTEDYNQLTTSEKTSFITIPEKELMNVFQRKHKFSFSGETV